MKQEIYLVIHLWKHTDLIIGVFSKPQHAKISMQKVKEKNPEEQYELRKYCVLDRTLTTEEIENRSWCRMDGTSSISELMIFPSRYSEEVCRKINDPPQ
jgi:hypothetical protein